MRKVSYELQATIVEFYKMGVKYKDIQAILDVNRWNIQQALSKTGVKTNRIKSPPRLPKFISRKELKQVFPKQEYHDVDFLPPMKPKENNPVLLQDDLDIMERMDNTDDTGEGSYEMVVDENGNVRCEKNEI